MDKVQGYDIKEAVLFSNNRGIALGENPKAPAPFVTWQFTEEAEKRDYYWGHYRYDRETAGRDFSDRGSEYMRQFNVDIVQIEAPGLYKYYSTQRPVDIGTFPKPAGNAPDEIVNYDQRIPVENGAFVAWGHLTYTKPLTEKEARDYELRPAPKHAALWREDRSAPIAQQMKEAGERAAQERGPTDPANETPGRGGEDR